MSTILLVDDDAIVRKIIGAILERSGFDVLAACDGEAAVEMAAQHDGDIAVLISDLQMPGLSGEQLAVSLAAARPNLKVLLISAERESAVHLRDGWMFLRKPFAPALLLERLAELSPA